MIVRSYQLSIDYPIGPKSTRCFESQYQREYIPSERAILECHTKTPNVPYGKNYSVTSTYYLGEQSVCGAMCVLCVLWCVWCCNVCMCSVQVLCASVAMCMRSVHMCCDVSVCLCFVCYVSCCVCVLCMCCGACMCVCSVHVL